MQYAHDLEIVHRDIKPENVFLTTDGGVKLLDFGVGFQTGDVRVTDSNVVLGTPYYHAPEQLTLDAVEDYRVDIYALGVLMYRALAGRVPFDGDNPYTLARGILYELPLPPSMYNRALTPAIDAVVMKAMARNPRDRFQSAEALFRGAQRAAHAPERWNADGERLGSDEITGRHSLPGGDA